MNLVVDIGNTRTKYSVFSDGNSIAEGSTKSLTASKIDSILSKYSIERCIVSAVGRFDQLAVDYLKSKVSTIMLDSATPIPIANSYKTPKTLGSDRIAVAVAANSLYPKNDVLVIDCGTAITYDIVSASGEYLGGAISPGVNLRFKSLNAYTQKLPLLTYSPDFKLIGDTTESCIWSGVQNGVISEIDGFIDELKKKFPDLVVLLIGGDAKSFVNKLKNRIFVAQNLLSFGLNVILQYNKA